MLVYRRVSLWLIFLKNKPRWFVINYKSNFTCIVCYKVIPLMYSKYNIQTTNIMKNHILYSHDCLSVSWVIALLGLGHDLDTEAGGSL